jgi:hypothetical protein
MNEIDQRLEEAGAKIRATAAGLPDREAPGARRRTGARAAVAVAVVALGALFIVAPSVWLNSPSVGGGDSGAGQPTLGATSAPTDPVDTTSPETESTTVDPEETTSATAVETTVTTPTAGASTPTTTALASGEAADEWATLGEPISDDRFASLFAYGGLVPGSAQRLHWSVDDGTGFTVGLFAAQMSMPEPDGELHFCLLEYGSASGEGLAQVGGARCAPTAEKFSEMMSFGFGAAASCIEPAYLASLWGVPEAVDSVRFELSDGTQLVAHVTDGVAQAIWLSDLSVDAITFKGMTDEQIAEIAQFVDFDKTCAELNSADYAG